MIVRIDKNFKIIEKIEEEEDKPIVATEVGVRKLKIYLEEDNPELIVSITFKRADNFVIGAFNIPIIQNEMDGYYREYLFNNEDITAVAGALEVTIRFEKYFNNELIFSRPVNLVMAIYQAVATGNDTLSYLVEELEQTKRELKDIKESGVAGGGIPEAPIDNKLYGRKDEEWSEIIIEPGGNIDTLTLANKLCWRGDCKLVTETELMNKLKWRG